jgi:glutathione S-transferase
LNSDRNRIDLSLLIGNKNYSSWSLRPWLVLKQTGLEFSEHRIALYQPDTAEKIRAWTPSGKVPVLRHGATLVWDSLAICEYLAETFPDTKLWPREREQRARARAVSCEMHSGFTALRSQMPMNVRGSDRRVPRTPELEADIARVGKVWVECLENRSKRGPFLFGDFSIADAMYAPVTFRFATYNVRLGKLEHAYAEAMRTLPAMRAWAEAAAAELETLASSEVG